MKNFKYPPRKALFAPGIKLDDPRLCARVWWLRKFLDSLTSKDFLGRLARGKHYAISGQVTKLSINRNHVEAIVVGTRSQGYSVTIDFRTGDAKTHEQIASEIRREPMLLSRILAGDMPTEIESVFSSHNLDLFPGGKLGEGLYDMRTNCSCPDYRNPCKHSFAVLYILAEQIARDPSLLLTLRGFDLEKLTI